MYLHVMWINEELSSVDRDMNFISIITFICWYDKMQLFAWVRA
jgi:hypothetical protein